MIPASRRVLRGHVGAVVALVAVSAGLVAADRFLAATEASELAREARNEYATGMRRMSAHDPSGAAVHFGRAHMLVRKNREYQLALGEAYAESGQLERAQREIDDVLDQDSNDGAANLAMARLAARMGRTGDADAYYHRAVYGTWRGDGQAKRTAARLELAEYLAAQHRPEELLSEALVLQSEAASDPKIADRVAGFFLQAGSAGRAVAAYSELVKSRPDDAQALRGLADAQLEAGDFRHAEATWLRVVRANPSDPTAAARLRLAASLDQMDPTPRRLRSAEKLRRSEALLAAVRSRLEACGALPVDAQLPVSSPRALAAKNEDAESVITEAEKLWGSRPASCAVAADDPVPILMQKVGST